MIVAGDKLNGVWCKTQEHYGTLCVPFLVLD